ncbi:hypothetical protein O0L34_g15211 [Tuta absoluta]|nr:hypothetical protein O0L34_g15211 [Tuta absoluta]
MSVSLCVLRIEIDEDLPEMGDNSADSESAREQKKKDRGARESNTITVETYASVLMGPNTDTGILPTSSRRSPPEDSVPEDEETIAFFCGNPLVEVTKGVLHLYKENELKEAEEAKTLCLLSVPGALGAPDLLAFAAACQQDIAHVRVLRDGSADHYMALLTFRTYQAAREFHEAFDGVPYSSLEPHALCHMAWVSRVEWARDGTPPPSHTELPTCPVCLERMDESVAGVLSVQCAHAFHAECLVRWRDARCPVCRCAQTPFSSLVYFTIIQRPDQLHRLILRAHGRERGGRAVRAVRARFPRGVPGAVARRALPERMDESVAGVLSVQCAHAFHAECLVRWRDARCPVCRCAQTPEPRAEARCCMCELHQEEEGEETRDNISGVAEGLGVEGVEGGNLWICLICGHVGCGRYAGGHAAKHFLQSNHTYALQLGSNRVWDYAGDNFVHRLVQNKADGKLVAAEGGAAPADEACGGDKMDSAQLEFTYILTHQLDAQRRFYEERISKIESDHKAECEQLRSRADDAETDASKLKQQVHALTNHNKNLERKLTQVTNKLSSLQGELSEERGLAAALAGSQAEWQARAKVKEENFLKEVSDLKEQLRDVMFFVEARGQLQQAAGATQEEIAAASVSVAAPAKPRRKRR